MVYAEIHNKIVLCMHIAFIPTFASTHGIGSASGSAAMAGSDDVDWFLLNSVQLAR